MDIVVSSSEYSAGIVFTLAVLCAVIMAVSVGVGVFVAKRSYDSTFGILAGLVSLAVMLVIAYAGSYYIDVTPPQEEAIDAIEEFYDIEFTDKTQGEIERVLASPSEYEDDAVKLPQTAMSDDGGSVSKMYLRISNITTDGSDTHMHVDLLVDNPSGALDVMKSTKA